MKKLLLLLFMIILFTACNITDVDEPTKEINFGVDRFGIEEGKMKSFDINDWDHFYCPFKVTVTLINNETGAVFESTAHNSRYFFEHGTDPVRLPYGGYNCIVEGGHYPDNVDAYSASYYFWTIKDTTIIVSENSDKIFFDLDKTPSLIVRNMENVYDINKTDFIAINSSNDTLHWTGRVLYDFAYVTPWTYAGIYTDGYGNSDTVYFEAKVDNYYYFVTPDLTTEVTTDTMSIPIFTGVDIIF